MSATLSSDEIVAKLYQDMTFLAGEIALDRCRNRVLMRLVKENLHLTDGDLDAMFREEVGDHLEDFVRAITAPMVSPPEVDETTAAGCCGASQN
ncbi:MAG: hypothetical protein VKN33_06300 [Candidatus Sericytochromatia bacterium]|nr:hypothetical protein [Candidatus Sericytochromatia bacterium]